GLVQLVGNGHVWVVGEAQFLAVYIVVDGVLQLAALWSAGLQPHEHHRGDRPERVRAGELDDERAVRRRDLTEVGLDPGDVLAADLGGRQQGDVRGHRVRERVTGLHPGTGQPSRVRLRDRDGDADEHSTPGLALGTDGPLPQLGHRHPRPRAWVCGYSIVVLCLTLTGSGHAHIVKF